MILLNEDLVYLSFNLNCLLNELNDIQEHTNVKFDLNRLIFCLDIVTSAIYYGASDEGENNGQ